MSTSIGLGHRGDPSILREKLLNDLKRLESFLRILFKNRLALAGLVIILVFFALSALAPVLVGAYPTPVQGSATLQPPSDAHRLGTDYQGRDILTLLLYGGRISLLIGFSASAVAMILGTLVGLVGGYYGRITDQVLARATDFFLVIPWLPFAIVLSLVLGPSLQTTIIAIAVVSWPTTARVIRSQVLTVKERLFIERARAAGAGTPYIIWKHVLPNVMPLVWAEAVLTISNAVFTEAFLSFLTSNLPFSQWEQIFKDPMTTAAAIDRLVHHSVIIELNIPSYRLETAKNTRKTSAEAIPADDETEIRDRAFLRDDDGRIGCRDRRGGPQWPRRRELSGEGGPSSGRRRAVGSRRRRVRHG